MARISYSQMSAFDECPHRWYSQWIGKIWQPASPVMRFGGDVHKIIEVNVGPTEDGLTKAALLRALDMNFSYMGDSGNWRAIALKLTREARLLLRTYGIEPVACTPTTMVGAERRITIEGMVGIVDLIAPDMMNRLWVVDYKTTSQVYTDHDIRTSDQLTAYAWLVWKQFNIIPDHVAFLTLNRSTGIAALYRTHRPKERLDEFGRKVKAVSVLIDQHTQWKNPEACHGKYGLCHLYDRCWKALEDPIFIDKHKLPKLRKGDSDGDK